MVKESLEALDLLRKSNRLESQGALTFGVRCRPVFTIVLSIVNSLRMHAVGPVSSA